MEPERMDSCETSHLEQTESVSAATNDDEITEMDDNPRPEESNISPAKPLVFGSIDSPGAVPKPDKTILILGKTGTGKVDLAKHIFRDSQKSLWPEYNSVESVMRKASIDLHDRNHVYIMSSDEKLLVRVVIIDTHGIGGAHYATASNILQKLKDISKVHAIFFVMKYGRVTKDDCKPLSSIINNMERAAGSICHLVVTGCEGQSEAARTGIIDMYKDDELTSPICTFVDNKVILVGFPDLDAVAPQIRQSYEKGIERDASSLKKIIDDSKKPYTLDHINLSKGFSLSNCFIL